MFPRSYEFLINLYEIIPPKGCETVGVIRTKGDINGYRPLVDMYDVEVLQYLVEHNKATDADFRWCQIYEMLGERMTPEDYIAELRDKCEFVRTHIKEYRNLIPKCIQEMDAQMEAHIRKWEELNE